MKYEPDERKVQAAPHVLGTGVFSGRLTNTLTGGLALQTALSAGSAPAACRQGLSGLDFISSWE